MNLKVLPILPICDSDCLQCFAMGCMNYESMNLDLWKAQLEQVQSDHCEGIVLPQNFFYHHQPELYLTLATARGLKAFIRVAVHRLDEQRALSIENWRALGCQIEWIVETFPAPDSWAWYEKLRHENEPLICLINRHLHCLDFLQSLPRGFAARIYLYATSASPSDRHFYSCDELFEIVESLRQFSPHATEPYPVREVPARDLFVSASLMGTDDLQPRVTIVSNNPSPIKTCVICTSRLWQQHLFEPTYNGCEWVLINDDDSSRDSLQQVASKLKSLYPLSAIRCLQIPELQRHLLLKAQVGIGRALNFGARVAKGSQLLFFYGNHVECAVPRSVLLQAGGFPEAFPGDDPTVYWHLAYKLKDQPGTLVYQCDRPQTQPQAIQKLYALTLDSDLYRRHWVFMGRNTSLRQSLLKRVQNPLVRGILWPIYSFLYLTLRGLPQARRAIDARLWYAKKPIYWFHRHIGSRLWYTKIPLYWFERTIVSRLWYAKLPAYGIHRLIVFHVYCFHCTMYRLRDQINKIRYMLRILCFPLLKSYYFTEYQLQTRVRPLWQSLSFSRRRKGETIQTSENDSSPHDKPVQA